VTEPSSNSRRFASVAGKLAPKAAQPGLHAVPSSEPQPDSAPTAPANRQDEEPQAKRPRSPKKTEPPGAAGALRPVVFLAPAELREALRDRSRREKRSQPNVVLDAIEATHHDLPVLLEHSGPERTTLFVRPTARQQDTARVPVSVRLPSEAVETIDKLVGQAKAGNRTELLVAALRGYLTADGNT
jgi:hypothetical protein